MKKLFIILLLPILISCASIKDSIKSVEQSCDEAKQTYNEIKPKLDRDFKLLFGTKNGQVDTGVSSPQPGVQDIVYARFDTFSDTRQKQLKEANQKAIEIYQKYTELTGKIEDKGVKVCKTVRDINELAQRQEVSKEGLKVLRELIIVAGKSQLN